MFRKIVTASIALMASVLISARPVPQTDGHNYEFERQVYFELDKFNVDEAKFNNASTLQSIFDELDRLRGIGATDIKVHIIASASLEASEDYNAKLAYNRNHAVQSHLITNRAMNGVEILTEDGIYDWSLLNRLVNTSSCPHKIEVMQLLRLTPDVITDQERKAKLLAIGGGAAYSFIRDRFFHYMRYANVLITANVPSDDPEIIVMRDTVTVERLDTLMFMQRDTVAIRDTVIMKDKGGKFMVGVRNNTLQDIALIPNIGLDIYVSKNVSVGANWGYSWWKSDKKNLYWRTYGGDAHVDYWFNGERKWSGHHVGVYGQMYTYDFELKKDGVQGPKWSWGGGLSYGYAIYCTPHLSIDFGIGAGYFCGDYYKYSPSTIMDDKYYLESAEHLKWIGPTKAEISLIWKIGRE